VSECANRIEIRVKCSEVEVFSQQGSRGRCRRPAGIGSSSKIGGSLGHDDDAAPEAFRKSVRAVFPV
jgi:hypothetical protein